MYTFQAVVGLNLLCLLFEVICQRKSCGIFNLWRNFSLTGI